jgi:D-xylose transport system substrate-binding protein
MAVRQLIAVAVVSLSVAVATGCGGSGHSSDSKIALLLPENRAPRYEAQIRSEFEKKVEELCGGCKVMYRSAEGSAAKQRDQAEAALKQGAKALVIDPFDGASHSLGAVVEKSKAQHVPVLSYNGLILNARVDYYVAYDGAKAGEAQAETLAKKLKEDGHPKGPVVVLNGDRGNVEASSLRYGAHLAFNADGVTIGGEYTPPEYHPPGGTRHYAQENMRRAIAALGVKGFAGVYATNDEIAEGAIAAMDTAGIDPEEKPTTGEGATLAGLQRVLAGPQYMTIYGPIGPEASVGAEFAVDLAEGREVPKSELTAETNNGARDVPAVLLRPVVVTKDNLKQTVIADEFVTPSELCLGAYASACREAGIS